jgi:hypothetical protein
MPTKIQEEAAAILETERKIFDWWKQGSGWFGTVVGFTLHTPIGIPIFLANQLVRWKYKEYHAELEKVVRGERTTLPTRPPDSRGWR